LLDQDPTFKEQVETYRRRLLADKIMQKYLAQQATVSDQEVKDYYNQNKDSFVRDEDEIFALHVLLPTQDEARELRNVLRDNDLDKKAEFLRKYQNETGLFKLSDLIPEIRNRLARTRDTGVIGPIRSDFGYHILNVTQWYDKDSVRPLEEVWDEIAGRLAIDKQNEIREAKIDSLRHHANVNLHIGLLNSTQD
jgi:foldase protein PrsA